MKHRPLVGITVSFSTGIFVNYLFNIPFIPVFFAAFTLIIVHIILLRLYSSPNNPRIMRILQRVKGRELTLFILILLTGIAYHQLRIFSHASNTISNFMNTEKIPAHIQGVVISPPISQSVSVPLLTARAYHKTTTSFLLRAEGIDITSYNDMSGTLLRKWRKISGILKVNVYRNQRKESAPANSKRYPSNDLKYGDRIILTGNVSLPSKSRNPGQFDYQNYLKRQTPRVEAIATIAGLRNIKVLSEGHGNFFYTVVYRLKKKLNTVIGKNVKKESIPLVRSILLGDREKVPEHLMDGFLKTGTIHFLAISGLHVGILVVSLHYFLMLSRISIRALAIIIILTVFFYAAITGMKPPILRAGIMVAMYYGAYIINRRWDLQNSIAAAVFIILLLNPSDLFNVGFQLSVLAVLGIIFTSDRLENFFWKTTILVEKLQAKEERNEAWFRFKVYCRKTFCVSLGAWIAVMPLIAYYFHIVTPLTVFLNMLVFPLIWIILVGGFTVVITGLAIPVIATPFAWLVSSAGIGLEKLILLFSENVQTFFYTATPLRVWIAMYYLIAILFIIRMKLKIKLLHLIIATLAIFNIFLFSGLSAGNRDCLALTCFDVRHGASFFIQFPNGKNMLFDSGTMGTYDVGKSIVAPFLRQKGIRKLDTVIISHEHDDHCNGIPSLLERFNVDKVFVNKFFLHSGNRVELLKMVAKEKIQTGVLAEGVEIRGYEPAQIRVLNPPDKDIMRKNGVPADSLNINDSCNVLLIDYSGYRILLCADIGERGIEMLLSGKRSSDTDISAEILQVPHHGSFIKNTEDLIKRVQPEHAIISGPAKDISTSTVENYQKYSVILHKTHDTGAVTFTISKEGIKVSTFL